jgi:hypothetical protein
MRSYTQLPPIAEHSSYRGIDGGGSNSAMLFIVSRAGSSGKHLQ